MFISQTSLIIPTKDRPDKIDIFLKTLDKEITFFNEILIVDSSKENIHKKIKRNRNYFYSAKDLAVLESLEVDGIKVPKEIDHENLKSNYSVPDSLLSLAKKGEKGFLALKIVEIIGEDEVISLDSETIYFITHLLKQLELKEFRNEILGSALPLRI